MANDWLIFDSTVCPQEELTKKEEVEDQSKETLETEELMTNLDPNDSKSSSIATNSQMSQASIQSASLMSQQSVNASSSTTIGKSSDSQMLIRKSDPWSDGKLFKKVDKKAMAKSLGVMERAIMSNIYEKSQFKYRRINIGELMMSDEGDVGNSSISTLRLLWGFFCDYTKERTVTCLSWNHENSVHFSTNLFIG